MINFPMTDTEIVASEPYLTKYYEENQSSSFQSVLEEARQDLLQDLSGMGFDVNKLCVDVSLQDSVTKLAANAPFEGSWSDVDYAKRRRLVIVITSITSAGTAVLELNGTNEEGTPDSDDVTVIYTKSLASAGTTSYLIPYSFKRYRVDLNSLTADKTVVYNVYIIEDVYYILLRNKVREKIFGSLVELEGDRWDYNFKRYKKMYDDLLVSANFYVDKDEDETIDEQEGKSEISKRVTFKV